ncbi:MAG TPA: 3,4-dihydroxy-2-butanone-4-phosphate synthase [Chloroflexota bacterium]|nr:3,4-dihydroxy-2-butanone-4-phosphate synthase [Chloroflexota bacterium]
MISITASCGHDRWGFATVDEAARAFRSGGFVLIVDDEERENEGDLTVAAEHVTAETIAFMATYGRGLICMPMTGPRLDTLRIPLMIPESVDRGGTAFTVSVDARGGTSGISARDRARTVRALIDPATSPDDLIRPGHLFPLRAAPGGVLQRRGHTEASVDLARIAGCFPAAVICEVMKDDGTMARRDDLVIFARRHGICAITVDQVVEWRQTHEIPRRQTSDSLAPAYTL